jgi:hypothetical protein
VPWCDGYGVFRWADVLAVPPGAEIALVWIYRAALALAIVGVRARTAALVAALSHAAMWSIAFSTAHGSVHNHAVFMILVSLALLPEPLVPLWRYARAAQRGEPLAGVATYPAFARYAAIFAVATVYVQTGVEKILYGGPRWLNGVTLQGYVLRKGELSTSVGGLPIAAFVALSALVVIWESGYGAVFFRPRLRPFALLGAWAFHEWVRWGMGVWPFFFMEAAGLFVFTPYEAALWFRAFRERERAGEALRSESAAPSSGERAPDAPAPGAPALGARPTWRLALLGALLVAQWVPIVTRRGVYPFASNSMFSGALRAGTLMVGGARIVVTGRDEGEREVPAEVAVSIRSQRWNELIYAHFLSPYREDARFAASRPELCGTLFREILQYIDPRALRVSLWMDHFTAGQTSLRTRGLIECGADTAPGVPGQGRYAGIH